MLDLATEARFVWMHGVRVSPLMVCYERVFRGSASRALGLDIARFLALAPRLRGG